LRQRKFLLISAGGLSGQQGRNHWEKGSRGVRTPYFSHDRAAMHCHSTYHPYLDSRTISELPNLTPNFYSVVAPLLVNSELFTQFSTALSAL